MAQLVKQGEDLPPSLPSRPLTTITGSVFFAMAKPRISLSSTM